MSRAPVSFRVLLAAPLRRIAVNGEGRMSWFFAGVPFGDVFGQAQAPSKPPSGTDALPVPAPARAMTTVLPWRI